MRVIQSKGTTKAHVSRRKGHTKATNSWLLSTVYDKYIQEQPEVIRLTLNKHKV